MLSISWTKILLLAKRKRTMTEVLYPQVDETRDYSSFVNPTGDWYSRPSVRDKIRMTDYITDTILKYSAASGTSSDSYFSLSPTSSNSVCQTVPHSSKRLQSAISSQFAPPMSKKPRYDIPIAHPSQQPVLLSHGGHQTASSITQGQRSFASIAPDPRGLQRIQAVRQSQEYEENEANRSKRQRVVTTNETSAPPLRSEDKLLLTLKDEQSLPWRDIATRFQTELGKVYQIPALQMRYKRLKERLQVWTESDVQALKQANEYWETRKFEILANKMIEFGASEKFSPRACARKWQEIYPESEFVQPRSQAPSSSFLQSVSPQPITSMQQSIHPTSSVYANAPGYSLYPSLARTQTQADSYVPPDSTGESRYTSNNPTAQATQQLSEFPPVTQGGVGYW